MRLVNSNNRPIKLIDDDSKTDPFPCIIDINDLYPGLSYLLIDNFLLVLIIRLLRLQLIIFFCLFVNLLV